MVLVLLLILGLILHFFMGLFAKYLSKSSILYRYLNVLMSFPFLIFNFLFCFWAVAIGIVAIMLAPMAIISILIASPIDELYKAFANVFAIIDLIVTISLMRDRDSHFYFRKWLYDKGEDEIN